MTRGRPIVVKCPRCKRGKYGENRPERGVMVIGHEVALRAGKSSGFGGGGRRFYGHRGICECLDCGHVWSSTLCGVEWFRAGAASRG